MPGHQHAVRLLAASSHTPSQLMQLAQPESLRALDHHHRCVRHIHSDLDHGSRNEDVRPSRCKGLHIEILHVVQLLSMHHCGLVVGKRKMLDYFFCSCFKALIVKFLSFVYQWIYYEYLSPFGDLVAHELIKGRAFPVCRMDGPDRLSSRGKFVDYRHVKVAVQGHRKCPRDRRRCHHEHMRRCA